MVDAVSGICALVALGSVVVFAAYGFIIALVIICLVRMSRYFMNAGKEQKLMRMELGKLAEEVHIIRQKLEGGEEQGTLR
jgi:hypothetical protein